MSTVLDTAYQWRLLSGSHPRKEASNQPCSSRRPRCQRHAVDDCAYANQHSTQSLPKNRSPWISSDQGPGQRHWEGGHDGPSPPSSNKGRRLAPSSVYERLGAKTGAPKQGLSVPHCKHPWSDLELYVHAKSHFSAFRSQLSHMKLSLSEFLPEKSRTKPTMLGIGIGHTGILTQSSIVSSSCSDSHINM